MKKLILACLFTSLTAMAEPTKLARGTWELNGAMNFTQSSDTNYSVGVSRGTSFRLSGGAQYFWRDRWSVGANLSLTNSGTRSTIVMVSPAISRYFFVREKYALYFTLTPAGWAKREGSRSQFHSSLRLGTKFFLTENISLGPAIEYQYGWNTDRYSQLSAFSVLGLFSLHL